ncbi:xanthine dehydrogenase family protein molybdopterin-binding subunit [Salibaculum sp.]|uniref:xanthine dehydrogenase family protein molybdopterin-binding subunit n=1 Tax=Salibaculum sp. TaxID=2855480 RepID=UPI002B46F270|nr:molybdopterin cofactor-binding domain-containing protein [Salibaculum sp.]HKL70233.1 molybdopterin cofactor-binding domain-containing protein [Salibaculum sp.]
MSRLKTLSRRGFLIGTTVVGGAVVFGSYLVARPHENPLADDVTAQQATFNPWIKIGPKGITLITPHADLGQGTTHMQAILLAEELDLELDQFTTEFGEPAAAYYNRGFAAEGADVVAALTPLAAETVRGPMGAALKIAGIQGTGGSTAAADSFDKLRQAGASARETLKLAASQRSNLPVEQLTTERGAVVLPDGTRLAYTDLATEAGALDPVQEVALRPASDWRLVGQPTERLDILDKSTGRTVYGIDLEAEGMVHATVVTNPRRGEMLGYDAGTALEMPGVQGVVEVTGGLAVLADSTWRAFKAARAINFDWGPAPYHAEQADHWAEVSASFTDARLNATWRDDGDAGAASGDQVIEAEYRAPYVAHQPLEPLNALVTVTEDGVDIATGHQLPRFVQTVAAGITGHDADQVRFVNQYAGGSFGHRLEFEHIKRACEIANQRRGTPIKLTYTREEDFAQDFPRHIAMARGRGAVANGRVRALDLQIAGAPVFASQGGRMGAAMSGPDNQLGAGAYSAPYALPDFRVRGYAVPDLAPVSSWRSVGASFGGFFLETFLDELIHAAGADPVAERLRLITDPVARDVLSAAAEMAGWGRDPGPNRGLGVALVRSFGVDVAEIAEVEQTEDGLRIRKVWAVADPGPVIDPVNIENHIQGGVIWGMGHAMNCEVTYADGMAQQSNFHQHAGMRLWQTPEIEVRVLQNRASIAGIGEPPVPPAPPALANAIFAATGTRLRGMPFNKTVTFA